MIKRITLYVGSVVLAFLAGTPAHAQTYSNAVVALNPVAYWPLTETTPPPSTGLYIATNSGSLGVAGNGYYETWWQPDAFGVLTNMNSIVHVPGAIVADSDMAMQQGAIGQYVVIPRATNGVPNPAVTLTPPFSIEMWIYPTNAAASKLKPVFAEGFNTIQDTNQNYVNVTEGTALGMYSGFLYFNTFNGAGTKTEIDTGTLVLNAWHHIVATFDGVNQTLYLDSALVKTKSPPVDALGRRFESDPVSPMIVGGGNELGISGGANVPFGGAVDEVAVYNTALSQSQVTTHFQAGTNATPTTPYNQVVTGDSPIIYLRLDEPAFVGPSATNSPMAANVGSLGASANGYYLPGSTPGISGPAFGGFPTPSYGVAFNGFNSAVDVGAGALPTLLNPTNHQPMTVTAWFKGNPADAVGRFQILMGHSDSSWRLAMDGISGNRFNPGNGPELQFVNINDELTNGMFVNDNNWHFVAGVSDGTNDSLYVDGLLAKSGTNEGDVTNGSTQDVILGGDPQYLAPQPTPVSGGGRWFDGSLAHVAFFTNALSLAQIQQLYTVAGVPPFLWLNPQSVTNNAGANVTISAAAHGSSPFFYQWYQNGNPVAGQTNATLAYTPASITNAGSYFVVVTNNYGAVTSSVVTLFLYGPPIIQQQSLTDLRVFAGTSPTLHVSALGAQPIIYQWSAGGSPIPGATNSSYTIANAQASGTYTCSVTNFVGPSTTSFNPVTLTVLPDPTAPYPAAVLASGPIDYFRLDEADTGYPNDGVTAYDYAGGNNGSYSNTALGQMTYSPATDPSETSAGFGTSSSLDSYMGNVPPYLDLSVTNGGNAEFTVEAWANGAYTPLTDAGIVTIGYGYGGEQICIDCGANETTHPVRFYVNSATGVNYKISSSFALADNPGWHHIVAVCDEAGGHLYLYIDGVLNGSTTIPSGAGLKAETSPLAIGSRLSTVAATDYDNQFYGNVDDVAIYNYPLSAAQVQAHYFGSGIGPVITQITPQTWTTNQNTTVTFTVTATGTAPLFYQWLDPNNSPLLNQTNATLVLTNVLPAQSGQYTVVVTNLYNTASTNAYLTVNQGPPVITTDLTPTNLTVFAGSPVTYTLLVSGSPPFSYQWFQNGSIIPNTTNASYSFAALLGTNTYYVTVTNAESGGNPTVSATVTVVGMPSTTLNPANYSDHLKITFAGYNRAETLQDFPVLVELSTNIPGFSYAHFASGTGGDLRFTDSSGTRVIPHEIDEWNPNGESIVWVQMPTLSSTNDYIWAYWGNSSDTTPPAGTNVWVPPPWEGLPSYAAVYHLKENGFPYADSTTQYPALTGTAPTQASGLVGLGQLFATPSFLDAGTINLSNAFTVSAWVNLTSTDNNIQTVWANKIGGYSSFGFGLYVNSYNSTPGDGEVELETGNGTNGLAVTTAKGALPAGQWHLLTAVINPTAAQAQIYVDAAVVGSGAIHSDLATNNDMRLGIFDDNSYPFNGLMDEARVRLGTNSVNWIWASYMTVAQNSSLESYAPVSSTVVNAVTIQFQKSGNNLVLSGSGGPATQEYRVLSSTNLTLPTAQWTPVATNSFDSNGNWTNTVPLDAGVSSQFFRVVIP